MTTTQLWIYHHNSIISISKRFTSSHQIRVGLSLVFYNCDNHDIKADDCLLPKTMDRIVRSLPAWYGLSLLPVYICLALSTSHKGDDALSIVRGICSTCGRNRVRYCLGGCPWVCAPHIYQTLLCFYIRDSYNVLMVGMASVTKSLVSARFSIHFPQCGNRHRCRFKVG